MNITSLFSSRVVNVDVPEVTQIRGRFVYNFFTKNEKVNDGGEVRQDILTRSPDAFDPITIDRLSKFIPRFVRIEFTPVQNNMLGTNPHINDIKIKDFLNVLQDEQKISGRDFTRINFQESNLNGKLFFLARKVLEKKIDQQNAALGTQVTAAQANLTAQISLLSPVDQARLLNNLTSTDVSSGFIVRSLNNIRELGSRFIDEDSKEEIVEDQLEELTKVSLTTRLNNKVVAQLARTSATDSLGSYEAELTAVLPTLDSLQVSTRASSNGSANVVRASDYETEIDYIRTDSVDANGFIPSLYVKGYIVDKYEVQENGSYIFKGQIVLENSNIGTTVDLQVKYGATYVYTIRSIALVNVEAFSDTNVQSIIALVSSKPSQQTIVHCTEAVPPPPPADFDVVWDYQKRVPCVFWSFPINTQRDVKKFQIFKRLKIDSPFELVKMYDFDDSVIKTQNFETPDRSLVETLEQPITFYYDNDFNKEGSCIYSVCCVDAHGFSSNYSVQFRIRYDAFSNKLVKELVSTEGAPKAYPNMFLNEDTFVDTIKSSGAGQLKVIFNPEYLKVENSLGEDMKLLATNRSSRGKYRLQFINMDLQQQVSTDINLIDRRST